MTPALELDLDHDYLGTPVLRGVALSLGEGEHLAVLGPSGCGKSTLLRLITGLETPTRGRVYRRGVDITGTTGRFGFMSQQDLLLPWKRLWENAALPLLLQGVRRAEARRTVESRLAEVGLEGFADHYPHQLSGGMRQRAAFLRTSLASRDLLLLDEPFAALDVLLRAQLQEWLAGMLRRENAALVLVTHSVEEALLLADRVVVLSPSPGRPVLEEKVGFAEAPFAEKPYLPEFLAMKRRVLDVLLAGSDSPVRSS
jgi:ABC-type nitrate/sulfonate/bicarbonate transport system ATPase subunit